MQWQSVVIIGCDFMALCYELEKYEQDCTRLIDRYEGQDLLSSSK